MKNGTMMQYFEWNMPNDGQLWNRLKQDAEHLADIGITAVWLPPACKSFCPDDVGYGVYDLYDLGEFDQKGAVRTKYGTRAELLDAINTLHEHQISVYLDAVMNHKAGADYTETFMAREVNDNNRLEELTAPYEIEGWTGFDFPGRGKQYSDFKWHWYHFSGTDYDARTGKTAVFKIVSDGKNWSEGVAGENGNYDYLMFADIDFDHPEVVEEMKSWGRWVTNELNLDGMRLDAIKHMNDAFVKEFLAAIREDRPDFYAVGEYWSKNTQTLDEYLQAERYTIDLFDVPLHFNMHRASEEGQGYDLSQLLNGTLVQDHPALAVTFVENHDTQQGSSLQSCVADWFKPAAYALILLNKDGYPCIFYGDYYGPAGGEAMHRGVIDTLLKVRQTCAFGEQCYYFDHPNTVGFTRTGDRAHRHSGCAVLISNGEEGFKPMYVGEHHAGEVWHEVTGVTDTLITIDSQGHAVFLVPPGKLAVWVNKKATV